MESTASVARIGFAKVLGTITGGGEDNGMSLGSVLALLEGVDDRIKFINVWPLDAKVPLSSEFGAISSDLAVTCDEARDLPGTEKSPFRLDILLPSPVHERMVGVGLVAAEKRRFARSRTVMLEIGRPPNRESTPFTFEPTSAPTS